MGSTRNRWLRGELDSLPAISHAEDLFGSERELEVEKSTMGVGESEESGLRLFHTSGKAAKGVDEKTPLLDVSLIKS